MRKILFGAVLGAILMYFCDPQRGAERRELITGLWGERKDTVLEAARTTAEAVSGASQQVQTVIGDRLAEVNAGGDSGTNGAPVSSTARKGGAEGA
jgi:hypothetical protein